MSEIKTAQAWFEDGFASCAEDAANIQTNALSWALDLVTTAETDQDMTRWSPSALQARAALRCALADLVRAQIKEVKGE